MITTIPLPLEPGEVYVSVDGETSWPATVDLTDRWNGWLSPCFRPDVARALVDRITETNGDDPEQDQLILSPDGLTIAHLVWDEDVLAQTPHPYHPELYPIFDLTDWPESWLSNREHSVWLVYPLVDASGADQRVAIGAWRWCWYHVPNPAADPIPRAAE